jgi:hypothetical protein
MVRGFGCYLETAAIPSCRPARGNITQPAPGEVVADIVTALFTSFRLAHRQSLAAVVALMYVGGRS